MKEQIIKIKTYIINSYESTKKFIKNIPNINLNINWKIINISDTFIIVISSILVSSIIVFWWNKLYDLFKNEPIKNKNIQKEITITPEEKAKKEIIKKRNELKNKTPARDEKKIKTEIVWLPNLLNYWAEPMFIKEYNMTDFWYFEEKSKNFSFDILKNYEELYNEYKNKLSSNWWKIEEINTNWNAIKSNTKNLKVSKEDLVYNITIWPAYWSWASVDESKSKIVFMYMADNNLLFKKQPKAKNLVLPPIPEWKAIFESIIWYLKDWENNLKYEWGEYSFVYSGSLDQVALDLKNRLKLDWYEIETSKAIPKEVDIKNIPNPINTWVVAPILRNNPINIIKPSPSWNLKLKKGNYLFSININENLPWSNDKIEWKVILTLRTNAPLLQEWIDFFKVKSTTLDKFLTVKWVKNKYASYNASLANETSIPLINWEKLPVPIVFATWWNIENILQNLENDLKANNYSIKNTIKAWTWMDMIESAWELYDLKINITTPIPNEYSLLFSGSTTMVEITPNIK